MSNHKDCHKTSEEKDEIIGARGGDLPCHDRGARGISQDKTPQQREFDRLMLTLMQAAMRNWGVS